MEAVREVLAVALVVLGLVVQTLAVYGMSWMPDTYTRLHAASKSALLGILPVLAAAVLAAGLDLLPRALLVGAALVATVPVSAHAIARAAWRRGEEMKAGGAVHEEKG